MSVMYHSAIIRQSWIILLTLLVHNFQVFALKQEGDACLIGEELRGICTSYQQCRSAQDLIEDGSGTVLCNPQGRNRNLVCCVERGRRDISVNRDRNNIQIEQNDEIETIYDARKSYQDGGESGRKKHSIPSPSASTRQKNTHNNNYQSNFKEPHYVSQEQTTTTGYYAPSIPTPRPPSVRRPINEHIDLNYYEDDDRGRYQQRPVNYNYDRETTTTTTTTTRRQNYRPQSGSNYFTRPSQRETTQRYQQKTTTTTTSSPWQEAPSPLVEDENGYSQNNYYRPTVTTPVPKREKRISEIKCKEYSEVVTETIAGLPLTTDPKPVKISIQKCSYNAHQLIVGGQNTSVGEFPHMAAIGFLDRNRRVINWNCGGTLISENFVLTAAHCTTSSLGSPSVVRLGEHNLVRGDDGAHPVDYLVKEVVRHPDYRPPMRYNDIALLRLSRHVLFTTNIRPACLYSQPTFNTGKTIATGWGRIQYAEEQSDVLLKVVLSIIDNERCNGFYKSESKTELLSQGITHKQMCAGELTGGKDTCQGDSGGPIEVTSQGNKCVHHVIGITSFGKRCGQPNAPGVYTRVSSYLAWIEGVVWPELVRTQQKNKN